MTLLAVDGVPCKKEEAKPASSSEKIHALQSSDNFCTDMRKVLDRLAEIVQEENDNSKKVMEFLTLFFAHDRDSFCQFVGFVRVEIKKGDIPKSVVVDILTEMTMAGMSLGWDEGYAKAKRIYWGE